MGIEYQLYFKGSQKPLLLGYEVLEGDFDCLFLFGLGGLETFLDGGIHQLRVRDNLGGAEG